MQGADEEKPLTEKSAFKKQIMNHQADTVL